MINLKPIPHKNKSNFKLKDIGAETVIGIVICYILANEISGLMNPLLKFPFAVFILVLVISAIMPSTTNRNHSKLEALFIFLKFKVKQIQINEVNKPMKGVRLMFKNFLNRGNVTVDKHVIAKREKILLSSLEDAGIQDIQDDVYIDKNNKEIAVFLYEFKEMLNISAEVRKENHENQTLLFDALQGDGKLTSPKFSNNSLNETHAFFLNVLEDTKCPAEVEEMLLYLAYYQGISYPVKTIEIETSDIESFLLASGHLNVERLTGERLIQFLHSKQSGGKL
ncbi:hypothetical protein G7062_10525 [Erysipelothrix sp. HDW6C]|uniref:hypothetical protein n=1 Tax=Erysipelothrix sp. HDW6C TaxID=2714930 RepID=UPI0014081FA4|nr:hypothetical protein [Erysipelothrix sp. HDW6C]QIK70711.1 hypothetical protein G7062_10525 [Erysipelothrix sp. HDW6C]